MSTPIVGPAPVAAAKVPVVTAPVVRAAELAPAVAAARPMPAPRPEPVVAPMPAPQPAPAPAPIKPQAAPRVELPPPAPRPEPVPERASEPAPRPTAPAQPTAAAVSAPLPQAAPRPRATASATGSACTDQPPVEALGPLGDDLTHVSADGADLFVETRIARFVGDVEVRRLDQRVRADEVNYDDGRQTLDATGNVSYQRPGLEVTGATAHVDLARDQGRVTEVGYRLTDRRGRGGASEAEVLDRDRSRYRNVTYTTCPAGDEDWVLQSAELEVDRSTGTGEAREASLRFKGVPLLYMPYATFPVDDRRKSGFLLPSVGSGERTGFDVSAPYYFNIAPEMDATLVPRVMSKRGFMLGSEFRYLTPWHQGELNLEFLPHDLDRPPTLNEERGAFSYRADGSLNEDLLLHANLNYVSDKDYLDDLGDSLAVTSARSVERVGSVQWFGSDWSVLGMAQYFQNVDETILPADRPYSRLPYIQGRMERPELPGGLALDLQGTYGNFFSDNRVHGQRVDLNPSISLPLTRPWGFLTPKVGVRYTAYQLNDQVPGWDDAPDRLLPTASVDAGLIFERETSWFDAAATQTLEPRLFYLYTPYEGQRQIPILDTSDRDFHFDNLFRDNRFAGADRVGDANQVALAVTSRLRDQADGAELARLSLGELFYFEDRRVQMPGVPVDRDNRSATLAEASVRLAGDWRVGGGVQWDPSNGGNTEQSQVDLRYRNGQERILNLAYRYSEDLLEHVDFSARWPLTAQIHAVAHWDYSLRYEDTVEGFAGFEYDTCCWAVRVVGRRINHDLAAHDTSDALFLQLELKGLTNLGNRVDDLLEEGILGYSNQF